MTVAEQLRHSLAHSGLTHYRIGKLSGVSIAIIGRFVAGTRDIRLETAAKLAAVLGLHLQPKNGTKKRKE